MPPGYLSGAALSDSMTFNNATFASLGVTPGTYLWSWGTGLPNQNFTLIIGGVGVPDGGSTVSLLGFALLGLVALRRKLSCYGFGQFVITSPWPLLAAFSYLTGPQSGLLVVSLRPRLLTANRHSRLRSSGHRDQDARARGRFQRVMNRPCSMVLAGGLSVLAKSSPTPQSFGEEPTLI